MVNIKRQRISGYVLLEALVATALFALIVSLVLTEINKSRQRQLFYLEEAAVYQLAKTAVQTGRRQLDFQGQEIAAVKTSKGLKIYHGREVLLEITED